MNPFVKNLWTTELRNPDLKQGKGELRSGNDELCCLGVLCEIAVRHGVLNAPELMYGEHNPSLAVLADRNFYVYGNEKQGFTLPEEVMRWAELDSSDPDVNYQDEPRTLAGLNDEGAPFTVIADVIDRQL